MPDTDTSALAVTVPRHAAVTVHLRGDHTRLGDLASHLPDDWAVVTARHAPVAPADLLVLCAADAAAVSSARAANPGVVVVAVINEQTAGDRAIEVLDAGADACVPAGHAGLIAGHLLACHRRRERSLAA